MFSVVEPLYNNINQSIHNAQLPAKVLRIIAPSLFDYSDDYNTVRDIISRYEKKYTDVLIQERLCDFAELREALYTDRADIVISENFALLDMQDIEIRHINSIEIYLMISSKHRLAQSDELDFSALSRETLYIISMLDEEADTKTQLDICDQLGVKPKKIEVMPNFQTILHNVNLGKGFSLTAKLKNIVPESSVRYYPIMRMKTPSVVVAWRKEMLNRHAGNFINMLPEADDIPPDDQAAAP